jgi:formylglycine-generating enzyme required for sulfatase activity
VAQFKAFVDDSTYVPQDKHCLNGPPNCPVVLVSWHDARAYCSWLDEMLRSWAHPPEPLASLQRRSGWRISLPTEAEWEKAARGTEGNIFPWGNELDPNRANYKDTEIGETSSVGCFPAGASPCGCLDMAGNVWEWCFSKYERYPYVADNDREDLTDTGVRVVRGGSFNLNPWDVRCACRDFDHPVNRYDLLGFRVVVVSPGSGF